MTAKQIENKTAQTSS